MKEKSIYKSSDGNIWVTDKRFIVNGTTYPIRQISSVTAKHHLNVRNRSYLAHPRARLVIGATFLGCFAFIFLGILGDFFFFIGLILLILGVCEVVLAALFNWKLEYSTYSVTIDISSGKTQAYVSFDSKIVKRIASAVNKALVEV